MSPDLRAKLIGMLNGAPPGARVVTLDSTSIFTAIAEIQRDQKKAGLLDAAESYSQAQMERANPFRSMPR